MTVALCCDDPESGKIITGKLEELCDDLSTESFCSVSDFLTAVNDNPDAIMMITQKGSRSTETAIVARENNPGGKLIWFSDLDFALLSFRLKATYFGLLPIEDEKLKTALSYCKIPLTGKSVCATAD